MSVKYTDDFIRNLIELNKSGIAVKTLSKRFGIQERQLALRMRRLGHIIVNQRIRQLPKNELVQLYINGLSIKQLAEKYAVSREVIYRYLRQEGIEPRNRSAQLSIRMANTPEEERKRLVEKAHQVRREKATERESLIKKAKSRQIGLTKSVFGFGEDLLYSALVDLGFEVIPQFQFDIYNIDLLINGNIAVEVKTCISNPFNIEKSRIKTKKLLNANFGVIWVCATSKDSFIANFSNIIADIKQTCLDPSFIGKYRVIRCKFKQIIGRDKFNRFSSELSTIEPLMEVWANDFHLWS